MTDDTSYITHTSDAAIMGTADDALRAKLATVQAGYYADPYLVDISCLSSSSQPQFRKTVQPIIKRGTLARVACIDRAVQAFVNNRKPYSQVVVLGAGMDNSFLRHGDTCRVSSCDGEDAGRSSPHMERWFEVDLASVMQRKRHLLERHAQKWNLTVESKDGHGDAAFTVIQTVPSTTPDGSFIERQCTCLSHDLREPPSVLLEKLNQQGFSACDPVVFVMECVQMYLPETTSRLLWQELTTACTKASAVIYDPILLHDTFGRVMEQHLVRAGVLASTSSMSQTRTLQQQLAKLLNHGGFHTAVGCDMWQAYHTVVTIEQQIQANQAEFLDELEEWTLLMQHYCLVIACNSVEDDEGLCRVGGDSPMGFSEKRCQILRKS